MNNSGIHYYENIGMYQVGEMLRALRENGATVAGTNPWEVNTHQHGVRLRGKFHEATSKLEVAVIDRAWYVSFSMIWQKIDGLMSEIRAMPPAA